MNATTAMVLDTSPPCAGGPALLEIQTTATTSCKEIPEVGPTGPGSTSTQSGCPVKAGCLTKALATVPTKAPPSIAAKEDKEDPHTADKEAYRHNP